MPEPRSASQTARGVALMRAYHQLFDAEPRVLDDPVVLRFIGDEGIARVRAERERFEQPLARGLRAHVVLRSRFAEDSLREAVERGVEQFGLLGAGLDTFAYRQPAWARAIDIIEVDHPASQTAKRERLVAAGVELPANVRFAGIDFEHESLADGLRRCGVDFTKRTFFSWLGVTMYLTREAIESVLRTVAGFPHGSEIVLTFAQPREPGPAGAALSEAAAAAGEPWLSYFTPDEMTALLHDAGFTRVVLLSRDEAERRYFGDRADGLEAPRRVSIARATV